jgi:hypothetical protein
LFESYNSQFISATKPSFFLVLHFLIPFFSSFSSCFKIFLCSLIFYFKFYRLSLQSFFSSFDSCFKIFFCSLIFYFKFFRLSLQSFSQSFLSCLLAKVYRKSKFPFSQHWINYCWVLNSPNPEHFMQTQLWHTKLPFGWFNTLKFWQIKQFFKKWPGTRPIIGATKVFPP